ncbi:hypothetical protein [Dyadobacter sp. SG02]|uniref:hypothetical protein n=1 Tax=Dyadobacter sp. SG02 TaxID=1855291 RepID=UPI000B870169|nr:hypothetical protein [Dyadobacter sp. SG02]
MIALFQERGEMVGFAVYAILLYALAGGIGWLLTDRFIGINTLFRSVISFLSGLIILNVIAYAASDEILTLSLFETNSNAGSSMPSLVVHIVFLLSFVAALIDKNSFRSLAKE